MAIGRFSINYGSSTGFGGGFDIFSAIKERFGLSDPAGISVAQARDRQNAQLWSRSVIPSMANAAASAAQLRYLDKVLGLTQHKYRSQYPKHLQRKAHNDSNPSYNKEPKQWL